MKLKKGYVSQENIIKYLFEVERATKEKPFETKPYFIEGAFMTLPNRTESNIICISTQIGCKSGCAFCATSKSPFIDDLTEEEMKKQIDVMLNDNIHKVSSFSGKVEIAFEGMGEPLSNLYSVAKTIHHYQKYTNFKYVISTSGTEKNTIYKLSQEIFSNPVRLQLSLHFADDKKREKFMPATAGTSIKDILEKAKQYNITTNERYGSNHKVALNYLLLEGINDSIEDIDALQNLIGENYENFYVKLSHLNDSFPYKSPPQEKFEEIQNYLEKHSYIETKIFKSIGTDISAGCGQFSLKYGGK